MNRTLTLASATLAGLALVALAACATGTSTSAAATPAPAAAQTTTPAAAAEAAPAADTATQATAPAAIDTAGNNLADSIGAVTVVIDQDSTLSPPRPRDGATASVVEFDGKQALKVTRNSNGEVRVAFNLKQPAKLGDYKTLEFSIAGFNGYEGHYNCGLFYTENKPGATEKLASFYLSNCLKDKWTTVSVDLKSDEQWGKSYSPDRELFGIQFWSDKARTLYISGLTLKK